MMYLYNDLDLTFTKKISNCLISISQGIVSSWANNSVNFQPIFTNEVSKLKVKAFSIQ